MLATTPPPGIKKGILLVEAGDYAPSQEDKRLLLADESDGGEYTPTGEDKDLQLAEGGAYAPTHDDEKTLLASGGGDYATTRKDQGSLN